MGGPLRPGVRAAASKPTAHVVPVVRVKEACGERRALRQLRSTGPQADRTLQSRGGRVMTRRSFRPRRRASAAALALPTRDDRTIPSAPATPKASRSLDIVEDIRTCHFFTGLVNDGCAAGLRYEEVAGLRRTERGWARSLPCMPDDALVPASCTSFRESTPEEIAEEKRRIDEAFTKIQRGLSPCCDAPLEAMGGGWKACATCRTNVVHQCSRG